MPEYHPPPLKEILILRNPVNRPEEGEDRYGRPIIAKDPGPVNWPDDDEETIDTGIDWPDEGVINWPGQGAVHPWGVKVKGHQRDRFPATEYENGDVVYTQQTIWTIRHRTDIAANVEIHHRGKVYRSVGKPLLRGGRGYGRRTKYLEIVTEIKQ